MVWLVYHISTFVVGPLSSVTGTRWLTRWDKEADLLVKLVYYGLTTGRGKSSVWGRLSPPTSPTATQTLGEEYTDIWQYSASSRLAPPSPRARAGLILLPTLSAYVLGRWGHTPSFNERYPSVGKLLKILPVGLEVLAEVNLAIFYLKGTYYDIVKRLLGIQHVRSLQYEQ